MQLLIPFFPEEAKMISDQLGIYEKNKIVTYIAIGVLVYCHANDDLKAIRIITSNFIARGLCRQVDV